MLTPNTLTLIQFCELSLITAFAIIILLGTLGNILNLCVCFRRNMRKYITFRFLIYMSVNDILMLCVCATESLLQFCFNIEIRITSVFMCKFHTFISHFLKQFRNFIAVSISVQRVKIMLNSSLMIKESIQESAPNSSTKNTRVNVDKHAVTSFIETKRTKTKQKRSCSLKVVSPSRENGSSENTHNKMLAEVESRFVTNYETIRNVTKPSPFVTQDMILFGFCVVFFLANLHILLFLNLNSSIMFIKSPPSNFISKVNFNNVTIETKFIESLIVKYKDTLNYTRQNISEPFNYLECLPLRDTVYAHFWYTAWFWIDSSINFFIPFLTMNISMALMYKHVRKVNTKYANFLNDFNYKCNSRIYSKNIKKNTQLMSRLFMANIYFFVSNSPMYILFSLDLAPTRTRRVLEGVVQLLFYMNSSFSFLFYGVSSQKYRQELNRMFSRKTF